MPMMGAVSLLVLDVFKLKMENLKLIEDVIGPENLSEFGKKIKDRLEL